MAHRPAPPSLPANRLFLRPSAIGLIARSTGLVSRSMRPSSMKRVSADHRPAHGGAPRPADFGPAGVTAAGPARPAGPRPGQRTCPADLQPLVRRSATDRRLDLVELADPPDRLGRDRRTCLVQFEESASGVGPTGSQGDGALVRQRLEPRMAVDLQDAPERLEVLGRAGAGAIGRVVEHHGGHKRIPLGLLGNLWVLRDCLLTKRPIEASAPFPQLPGYEPVLLTVVALPSGVLLTCIDMCTPEGLSLQLVQPAAPHREARQKQKRRLPPACDNRAVTSPHQPIQARPGRRQAAGRNRSPGSATAGQVPDRLRIRQG